MQKKKCIIFFVIIFLISQIFYINPVVATNNVGLNVNSKVSINDNNTFNYSEAYERWLELSNTDKEKSGVIPRKYNIPLDSIYEDTITVKEEPGLFNLFGLLSEEKITSVYADEIPEEFDLRNEIDILVENQGTEGVCWAFASLTSLETNLALNGYGDYDFSERHIDYLTSYYFGGSRWQGGSGNFETFSDYIAKNDGPILEETVPYNNSYTSDEYEYLDSLKSQAYVTEKIDFPTIDKSINNYSTEELEIFRDKVKKHIMENGSLYACIMSSNIKILSDGENEYYTLYTTDGTEDHAISIIGWNDNFPKEYFEDQNGNMPQNDGAYIALNSWGEVGTYIYISYEDYIVEREMSGIVSATTNIDELGSMEVTFKDQNLYNNIKETYSKAIISSNDQTKTIVFLGYFNTLKVIMNISEQNISDLSGLEKFNLEILSAYTNNISDITGLKDLTDLYLLDLRNNILSDISVLSNLSNLRGVYLDYNYISDISSLKNLTNLEILSAYDNEILDISALEKLSNLIYLDISYNKISNISVLEKLSNLQYLDVSINEISNISSLGNLTKLIELHIDDNEISDISALEKLINLESLDASLNEVSDITALKNLTKLIELNLAYNSISEINVLENLTGLTTLYMSGNNIADINSIYNLTTLEYVYFNSNNIYQEISFPTDKVVTVPLPNIIKEAQNGESILYSEEGINFKNCNLSLDNNSVEIDTSMYLEASVTINSGNAAGTTLNIKVINTVADEIKSDEFTIIDDEEMSIIRGITPQTTSLQLKQNIESSNTYEVLDLTGNAILDTDKVGTGYKIKTATGKTYTIIVMGDLNGNGEISLSEVVQAARVAIGNITQVEELKFNAMDTTGNGKINVSDVAAIARLKIK